MVSASEVCDRQRRFLARILASKAKWQEAFLDSWQEHEAKMARIPNQEVVEIMRNLWSCLERDEKYVLDSRYRIVRQALEPHASYKEIARAMGRRKTSVIINL